MTEPTTPLPPKTHNLPPIVTPKSDDFLADLKRRFPKVETRLEELENSLKSYLVEKDGQMVPMTFTLEDEEVAAALQDLLDQIKQERNILAAHKKSEKKPWDSLVKIVQNFFGKGEEKCDAWLETWKPVHQGFLDLKADDDARRKEALLEAQRQEAARLAAEAETARLAKEKHDREVEEARQAEEAARLKKETAEREQREAEERAVAAREKEKQEADARKVREREEREENAKTMRTLRHDIRIAEGLNVLCDTEEASASEADELDTLIVPNGTLSKLGGALRASPLLDDDQKTELAALQLRLQALRDADAARLTKREAAKRVRLQKEEEERQQRERDERAAQAVKDRAAEEAARLLREKAEADALAAKGKKTAATEEIRDARDDIGTALAASKAAGKDVKQLSTDADRASNRADRIERKIESGGDTPLRGDMGTLGSRTRNWTYRIVNEQALRAVSGPLGEHFSTEDYESAAWKYMRAHQSGWEKDRYENLLPGVVFYVEIGSRIAG